MNTLLLLCLSLCLSLTSPETVTLSFGVQDNFSDANGVEYVPRSGILLSCLNYTWEKVPPYAFGGDAKPMRAPNFDTKPIDSALFFTVAGLPKGQLLQNARIEMSVRGDHSNASNDGFGFMWDDGACQAQYFRRFDNVTGFQSLTTNTIKTFSLPLNNDLRWNSSLTVLDRISKTGYFHFLVGDDTSVDSFRLIYDTSAPSTSPVVSFSCASYLASSRTLNLGTAVYTDDNSVNKISAMTDSTQYPFSGTKLIATPSADKGSTESTFKIQIQEPTRFWLFVPKGVTLDWLTAGGWQLLSSASLKTTRDTTSPAQEFSVYTKRYEGNRWVIFGRASSDTSLSSNMYFVSYTYSPSLVVVPSNPAASCKCSSTGDPHYVTWDNRRFDLYTPGTYHLVKARDCSFDVQTLTFKYGTSVSVNGIVSVRYLNNVVTLARTPATSVGGAWTGSPVVRLNGQPISSSITSSGITIIKTSADSWTVSISAVGLSVQAVASGNWFHVYPALSDPSYQRKVDGLCGNCDNNPSNDFKLPNCSAGLTSTAAKLTSADVSRWGSAWVVSSGELVADLSLLTSSTIGTAAYSSCNAAPIIQQCSDLIPPETITVTSSTGNTTTTTVVEPQEPLTFVTCQGTTPVHVDDHDDDHEDDDHEDDDHEDDDEEKEQPPPLCTERPDYQDIKARCAYCAGLTLYPDDDCILDICQSGRPISEYECAGHQGCVSTSVTKTWTFQGYQWATLGDGSIDGSPPSGVQCQTQGYRIPLGWQIAPNDDLSRTVISSKFWETLCMTLDDGSIFGTAATLQPGFLGQCPSQGGIIKTSDGCHTANYCNVKVLLRKPLIPECGNGILETGEQCDDGNKKDDDGCSSVCKITTPEKYSCQTGVNPTKCVATFSQLVGKPVHVCNLNFTGCEPCEVTPENQNMPNCCACQVPCC